MANDIGDFGEFADLVPKKRTLGDTAGDIGRAALGGAVQGGGNLVRGAGEALQSVTRRVSSAIDAPPPSENLLIGLGRSIEGGGQAINESVSPEGRRMMEGSAPTDEARLLSPSTWNLGTDPSIEGYALQGANVLGQAVPVIGTALATKGRMAPTAAVAGAAGGGGGATQEEQRILRMQQQQLDSVPGYLDRIDAGMSPAQARADLASAAAEQAFLSTAPISALSAFTEGLPITHAGQRALASVVGPSRLARVAAGTVGGFVGEGLQESAENAATVAGANVATGEKRDIGEGSFQNFLLGGLGGAPFGGVGGLRGVDGAEQAPSVDTEAGLLSYAQPGAEPQQVQEAAQENQQGSEQANQQVEAEQARAQGLRWAQVARDIAGPAGPIVNAMRHGSNVMSGNPVVDQIIEQQRQRDAIAAAEQSVLAGMAPADRARLFQAEQARSMDRSAASQAEFAAMLESMQQEEARAQQQIAQDETRRVVAQDAWREENAARNRWDSVPSSPARPASVSPGIDDIAAERAIAENRWSPALQQRMAEDRAPDIAAPAPVAPRRDPLGLPAPGRESNPPRGGAGATIITDRAGRAMTQQESELLTGTPPAYRAGTPAADAYASRVSRALGIRGTEEPGPFDATQATPAAQAAPQDIRSRSGNTFKSLKAAQAAQRSNPGFSPFEISPSEWVLRSDSAASPGTGRTFASATAARAAAAINPGSEVVQEGDRWVVRQPSKEQSRGTNVPRELSVTPAQVKQINSLSPGEKPVVASNGKVSLPPDRLRSVSAAIRDEFDGKTTAHAKSMLGLADRIDEQAAPPYAAQQKAATGETSMKSSTAGSGRITTSAGATSQSVKVDAVRNLVGNITKSWGMDITVAPTARDFPAAITGHAGFNDNVDAAVHGGKIYIAANRMRSVRQVMQTLAHEAVGHEGIQNMLGAKGFNEVLDGVRKLRDEGKMADIFAQVDKEYAEADERTKLREAVAHMAERGEKHTVVQRLIGAIRSFLRNKLGIKLDFTDGDLRRMLADAARFVERGGNATNSGEASFRKGDGDGKEKPGSNRRGSGSKEKAGSARRGPEKPAAAEGQRSAGSAGERNGYAIPKHDAPTFSQRKPREGSTQVLGVHYSSEAGLKTLDGSFAGSGSAGGERRRFGSGQYGKQGGTASRLYFYVQQGDALPAKEQAVVGSNPYRVQLNNVYDVSRDPLGIVEQVREENGGIENADLLEETLSELGFDGLVTDPVGGGITESVAVLFDLSKKVPVKAASSQTSFKKQTDTPEFKRWFGDSKVVDENGDPLVVYHGTTGEFDAFDPRRSPVNDDGYMGAGSYFASNRKDAENYADMARDNAPGEPRVIEAFLSIKNPYVIPRGSQGTYGMDRNEAIRWTDDLIARGYDGVRNSAGDEWVAFRPEQIKSATGNTGAFDPSNPDILFKKSAEPISLNENSTPLQAATAAWQHIASGDGAFRINLPDGEKDFGKLIQAAAPTTRPVSGRQVGEELYDAEDALMRAGVRFDPVEGNYYIGRQRVAESYGDGKVEIEEDATSRDQSVAIGRHANVIERFPALTEKPNTSTEDIEWAVRMPDGETAYIMRGDKTNEFYAWNPYLREKGSGTPFYQAFFAWAHNNGYVAIPDPDGLTPINSYRRTEQMLASALRFGSTEHLRPAMAQGVRRWIRAPKTAADNASNTESLIEALNSAYLKAMPAIKEFSYNFDTGAFQRNGEWAPSSEIEKLAKTKQAREIGLGRTTIERAIITNQVIRDGASAVAKVAASTAAGVTPAQYAEILYRKTNSNNGNLLQNAAMTTQGSQNAYGGAGRASSRIPTIGAVRDFLSDKAADTRPTWLKTLTRQQIVDVGRDQFQQGDANLATNFERLARKMEADAQLELDRPVRAGGRSISTIAEDWSKSMLPDVLGGNRRMGGEMAGLMYDTTLAGIDPSRPYQQGDDQARYNALRARFAALSPEHQALYRDVRDAYSKRRNDFYEALKDRITRAEVDDRAKAAMLDKLRIAMEGGRVKGPYFPLSRFGDYYVVAEGGPAGAAKQFVMAETQREQKLEAARLRAAGYTVRTGKSMKGLASELGPSVGFVGDMAKLIDAQHSDGEIDAGAADALKDGLYQMYLQTLPEQSVRKHFIHRKGTAGFSRDALRAFAHQMGHGSKQLARVRFSDQLGGTLRDMRKHADVAPDPNKAADIVKALDASYQWMMNPTNATWAQKATSLGFLWYLGVSPAAALVNVSQVPIITFPVLASKYGWGKSAAALASGTKDYVAASLNPAQRTKLDSEYAGDMGKMLDELEHSGAIDRTMTMSLMGLSDEKSTTKVGENRVMRIIGSLFHKAERLNREATAIATYRLARNSGSSHQDAVEAAYEAIFESHFDYSAANRANVFQGNAARVLLLFKQYSQNVTYFLARNAWNALKGESKEVRRQAATKLAGVLGMTGLFAGVTGLPGFGMAATMASLMHSMFGDDDEPYDPEVEFRKWLADNLGSAAPLVAKGAVNQLTKLDIAGRTGMGELWVRSPDRELEGDDLAFHYLEQAAGPAISIALQMPKAMKLLQDGHTERAVETMSPKFLKDWMKATRFGTEGAQNLRGDPVLKDVSAWNVINQAAGFSPSELSEQYDKNNALKNAEQHVMNRRQSLVNRWAMARIHGDDEGAKDAREAIAAFNKRWPKVSITGKTLAESMRTRRKLTNKSLNGINLNPKLRQELIEQYGF